MSICVSPTAAECKKADAHLAAGWTVEDLFSLPGNRAGADGGAIWTLAGFRAEAFESDAESIAAVMQAGHRLPYRRGMVTRRLPWRAL